MVLPPELDEARFSAAEEPKDGWTVVCGFEYWGVNRFLGMRRFDGG
jgi:hypothetical protein